MDGVTRVVLEIYRRALQVNAGKQRGYSLKDRFAVEAQITT